ncbi:pimeloyl-ACP methyl ester carboxylesterase [Micromonospora palomenae]|uniref:Pimeloyl-ACP methyl ester carboxylesterase n=1 Tax=Micromonospora palomenae TaxID=1461247 RepID=A0A561WSZ8_9ACTN|nr:alpha/beta hydrolase [Micromonospora palomenae]TWG26983.1 pimeloyl-ACP methyl ester carboxylesterase [Micromonospora palomenae]
MGAVPVAHRIVDVDGIRTFYRDAGPVDAPLVLLPHGYPSSSFQFRNLMPALGDRWRLLAPDLPGFGYTRADAAPFAYTFDGYADFLRRFTDVLGLRRYAIYLQDYGSQFGLRLAMSAPERVAALVIQNGDIYEDQHGPKYAPLKKMWADPSPQALADVAEHVSESGFRAEFLGEVPGEIADRISPDLWTLSWAQVGRPPGPDHLVHLLADQRSTVDWFPRQQAYLREHRPPTLIVWGPHDGYMPEGAARAYLRDLPDAELHLLDGGHWLLETHLDEVVSLMRDFLGRVHPPGAGT